MINNNNKNVDVVMKKIHPPHLYLPLFNRFCTFEPMTGTSVGTRLSFTTLPNLQKQTWQ